jgi:hypothetical protein
VHGSAGKHIVHFLGKKLARVTTFARVLENEETLAK